MDNFSALAQRVALGVGDVPGCLILSREGLVLGSYPDGDNGRVKQAWLRFAALGNAERGFIELADQIWVYARRGPYAAFAVGEIAVRPGLLLDMLEQALLEAEESRTRREGLRHPDGLQHPEGTQAPSGKLRTPMHPSTDRPQIVPDPVPSVAAAEAGPAAAEVAVEVVVAGESEHAGASREPDPIAAEEPERDPEPEAAEPASDQPEPAPARAREAPDDDAVVDRVMLAQEFSGLLQAGDSDDEG
jgi:hypothetical protein